MTLVLTCLSREYVVQVSDRRLTRADNPQIATSEHTNKAIFLDGRYIFGFTGLASLGNTRADLWFAEQIQPLNDRPLVDRLAVLGNALPGAVKYAPPRYRRHAFVGAGFARANGGPIEPFYVQLSNFLSPQGRPRDLRNHFEIAIQRLPEGKDFLIGSAGAEMTLQERIGVKRAVRRARKAGVGTEAIARILIDGIWRVARHNNTVGQRLMICVLPLKALGNDGSGAEGISGGINFLPDQASFFYLGPETSEGIRFGPTMVSPGMMVTDIRTSFGNADNPAKPPDSIAAIHFQGPDGSKTAPDAPCPCGSGKSYKGCHDQS